MRIRAFPIVASFALFAVPALAQTSTISGSQPYQNSTSPNASSGQQSSGQHQGITSDTQQKIRQSLENSGFRNVQVMPEAFVIRAQAPDGSRVVMLLRPDELVGLVQQQGATGSSQQPYGSSSQSYGSMQNNQSGWSQGNMTR